jgi:hypothetical protein
MEGRVESGAFSARSCTPEDAGRDDVTRRARAHTAWITVSPASQQAARLPDRVVERRRQRGFHFRCGTDRPIEGRDAPDIP